MVGGLLVAAVGVFLMWGTRPNDVIDSIAAGMMVSGISWLVCVGVAL